MKKQILTAFAVASSILGTSAPAKAVVLTFEGLADQQPVGNFYNGGAGGSYGITFTNAYVATEASIGGSAPYTSEPSRFTTMAFYNLGTGLWNTGVMNVSGGFDTAISFFYSSPTVPATVTVYDGLNGSGTVLASLPLSTQIPAYSSFDPVVMIFSGTAHSVTFSGATGYPVAYDDITINAVPEPSTALLFGTGFLAFGWYGRKRKEAEC
jgi:hypothetical protein